MKIAVLSGPRRLHDRKALARCRPDVTFAARLKYPDSPLWINILTHDEATALVARIKSGDTAAADQSALRTRCASSPRHSRNSATTHRTIPRSSSSTCRARFSRPGSTGASSRPSGTASGRRSTASTRAQVAAMPPAEIAAVEIDSRVIRNKAKIRATVENAREVLAILDEYGSIRSYLASFFDAARSRGHAAALQVPRRHGRVAAADQRVARHRVNEDKVVEKKIARRCRIGAEAFVARVSARL